MSLEEIAKAQCWLEQCDEMEQLQQEDKYSQFYIKIQQLTGRVTVEWWLKTKTEIVNGRRICNTDMEGIRQRFVPQRKPFYRSEMVQCIGSVSEEDDLPWAKLVEGRNLDMTVIKELKNGKSEEVDDVPRQMLKCL